MDTSIEVLGVFIGPGNLEEVNWQRRITAYVLLYCSQGKALVINALALSRISYVASLIHVPPWVLQEVNTPIYKFFWSG